MSNESNISNAELAGHLSSFLRGVHSFDEKIAASIENAALVMLNNYRDEVIDVEGAPADKGREPFAHCFTDVNGRPTQFCSSPQAAHEQDSRIITALYAASAPTQQAPEGFALIPLDPRNGSPKISSEMKAQCIGEFEFEIDEPCPKCALHLNEHYEDVECFCGGSDDLMYQKKISVPWDSVKLIYKGMAQVAMLKNAPTKQGEAA